MIQPLLVLDVHYLAHRAFHTSQELSWRGKATGVLFGFLKSIQWLKDEFQTDRIAFCFEDSFSLRRELYPAYKRRRNKERTDSEKKALDSLHIQISELRKRYLPRIGFKNVFVSQGYESDDLMASIALNCPAKEDVILVTADSDLYQCLRSNVMIYSPQRRKLLTADWFEETYRIKPKQWAKVKAIAGCPTDEVEGIEGIGEITALKYVRGDLPEVGRSYKAIRSHANRPIVRRNRLLVQLPFEGCPVPCIQEDEVSSKAWREVCCSLGMRTIAGKPPVATRKRHA